eukprot:TRINITY_DN21928_c0_g1_i1.p1 TRINITY_DN21928_c0_g1~~TRINITY_DN21928_c0_g1_i1.p1  ORF type:complete len:408 (-),score=77.62 TRINITY_DN21928_c0_g1_i1:74-1297(-)
MSGEDCRWAAARALNEEKENGLVDLPVTEQVARGRSLMAMLQGPEDATHDQHTEQDYHQRRREQPLPPTPPTRPPPGETRSAAPLAYGLTAPAMTSVPMGPGMGREGGRELMRMLQEQWPGRGPANSMPWNVGPARCGYPGAPAGTFFAPPPPGAVTAAAAAATAAACGMIAPNATAFESTVPQFDMPPPPQRPPPPPPSRRKAPKCADEWQQSAQHPQPQLRQQQPQQLRAGARPVASPCGGAGARRDAGHEYNGPADCYAPVGFDENVSAIERLLFEDGHEAPPAFDGGDAEWTAPRMAAPARDAVGTKDPWREEAAKAARRPLPAREPGHAVRRGGDDYASAFNYGLAWQNDGPMRRGNAYDASSSSSASDDNEAAATRRRWQSQHDGRGSLWASENQWARVHG